MGHKNIQHTVRYTELSPKPFRELLARLTVPAPIELSCWRESLSSNKPPFTGCAVNCLPLRAVTICDGERLKVKNFALEILWAQLLDYTNWITPHCKMDYRLWITSQCNRMTVASR